MVRKIRVRYKGKLVTAPKGMDRTEFRLHKRLHSSQLKIIASHPRASKGAKIAARFLLKLRKK